MDQIRKPLSEASQEPETGANASDQVPDDTSNGSQITKIEHMIRGEAERAAQSLMNSSTPAVLVASEWQVLNIPFAFEHMPLYEEVAKAHGYSIESVSHVESEGMEHLLFMTRVKGLKRADYLSYLET